jgi:hypothetical protein
MERDKRRERWKKRREVRNGEMGKEDRSKEYGEMIGRDRWKKRREVRNGEM